MSEATAPEIAATLAEKVLLICPTLSFWQGRAILPEARVHLVTKTQVDSPDSEIVLDEETTTRPQVIMLTDQWPLSGSPDGRPWKKVFNRLRTTQTTIVNRYSTCFPGMIGVRIVPKIAGVQLFTELNGLKQELGRIADLFCDNLEAITAEIQGKLPADVWASVKHKIPATKEAMRAKFGSAAVPIEISTGASSSVLSMTELQAFRNDIKAEIDSKIGSAIDEIIAAPRMELATAIDSLVDTLSQDNRRITDRSFNAVRSAFDKLRHFSFAASPDLLSRMHRVEQTLAAADTQVLRSSPDSRSRLVEAIHGITTELRDATAIADSVSAFKRHSRHVSL